jgi:hypothetical protein
MVRALTAPAFLAVAGVLLIAGMAKLRSPASAASALAEAGLPGGVRAVRALGLGEVVLALACAGWASRPLAAGLALVYLAFAAFTARLIRASRGAGSCGCFGEQRVPAHAAHVVLSLAAAALAAAATIAGPVAPASLGEHAPVEAAVLLAVAGAGAWAIVLAYTALPDLWSAWGGEGAPDVARARAPGAAQRLAQASGSLLERRVSRRGLLSRAALAGSAFAVAPVSYLLRPAPAWAVIRPGHCSGGARCNDGYTAFCCEINHGRNVCPNHTYIAGWWKCTDYRGRRLCGHEGVRYYVDCNRNPGERFPGGCRCAGDDCNRRRVDCNHFRYGQCNTQIHGTTEVVCRLVVCKHPASIADFHCNATYKVDDSTCRHDAGCLEPLVEQLSGGGGA